MNPHCSTAIGPPLVLEAGDHVTFWDTDLNKSSYLLMTVERVNDDGTVDCMRPYVLGRRCPTCDVLRSGVEKVRMVRTGILRKL